MIHCLHLRTNVYAIESCVMLRLWLLLMFIDSIMAYVSLIWSCIHLVIARPDLLKVNTFLKKLPQLWTNLHDKYVTLHHFYEQYVQHWIIFSIFDAIFATITNIWKKNMCDFVYLGSVLSCDIFFSLRRKLINKFFLPLIILTISSASLDKSPPGLNGLSHPDSVL